VPNTSVATGAVKQAQLVVPAFRAVAALVVVAWGVIAFLAADPIYGVAAIVASIAVLGGLVAFLLWTPSPGREPTRLVGVLVCLQTFLSSGYPILQEPTPSAGMRPTTESFTFAPVAAALFSGAFLGGVWLVTGALKPPKPLNSTSGPTPTVGLTLALITAGSMLYTGLRPSLALGMIPNILFNMSLLIPLFTAQYLLRGTGKLALGLLLGVQLALTFFSSMLGIAAFALRDVWLTYVLLGKKFPWSVGVAIIAAFVIINPAKVIFRQAASGSLDFAEAAAQWSSALEQTWEPELGRKGSAREEALKATSSRLDQNGVAAHVYSTVPARRPFAYGRTYEDIPLLLVPRVLYPNKPTTQGHTRSRWSIEIGIQNPRSIDTTAYAIPAHAEAYWNFGWLGVAAVPFLLGLFVGLILRINVTDPIARAGWTVLVVTSCTIFMDMLIWIVPLAVIAIVSAALVTVYSGLGRFRTKKTPMFGLNAKRTG
jgi:hypothetical protein